jgi:SAM-dependent methyltransferase
MKVARDLHNHLNINNIVLIPCSAEALPFEDGSFDLVYSSHVLEHIPDKEKALKEIYRVLKKGGIHFCVVPTRAEKCYALINFYTYLISRVFARIFSFSRKKEIHTETRESNTNNSTSSTTVLRDFPFPPPHGHYKHYLDEWKAWSPSRWMSLVCSYGSVKKLAHLTTQCNPLLSLLGGVFPRLATAIHALTRRAELSLGKLSLFRAIGINTVLLVQKTGE